MQRWEQQDISVQFMSEVSFHDESHPKRGAAHCGATFKGKYYAQYLYMEEHHLGKPDLKYTAAHIVASITALKRK